MSPGIVALLVAGIAAAGGLLAKSIETRATMRASTQQVASKTLDRAYEISLDTRQLQIDELRKEVAELTSEVRRLTALVIELGGVPYDQRT